MAVADLTFPHLCGIFKTRFRGNGLRRAERVIKCAGRPVIETLSKEQRQTLWMALALLAVTALLYWPVAGFDFINVDDGDYVFNNPHLNKGFSWSGLAWCFQAGYAYNWHPVTWMSHMLDCELFGPRPGPAHAINALLHALNSALLFLVLKQLTGAFWRSAMAAALFAWHPLRVESVAWISERKDVLGGLFWMLSLWAYVCYAQNLSSGGKSGTFTRWKIFYVMAVLFHALGLMAKPMVMTLPLVLLLLDWWPLGRMRTTTWRRLVWEKAPFLVLTVVSGVLTMVAQSSGEVADLELVPIRLRVLNSLAGYVGYLEKIFWPANLSFMYPLNFNLAIGPAMAALACLAVISAVAILTWKSKPYLFTGWAWYVLTLIPVIGIVQVGAQSMADRYTYIPCIGIFIIVCWLGEELTRGWSARRLFLWPAAALTLAACALLTRNQLNYWQNAGTLFPPCACRQS